MAIELCVTNEPEITFQDHLTILGRLCVVHGDDAVNWMDAQLDDGGMETLPEGRRHTDTVYGRVARFAFAAGCDKHDATHFSSCQRAPGDPPMFRYYRVPRAQWTALHGSLAAAWGFNEAVDMHESCAGRTRRLFFDFDGDYHGGDGENYLAHEFRDDGRHVFDEVFAGEPWVAPFLAALRRVLRPFSASSSAVMVFGRHKTWPRISRHVVLPGYNVTAREHLAIAEQVDTVARQFFVEGIDMQAVENGRLSMVGSTKISLDNACRKVLLGCYMLDDGTPARWVSNMADVLQQASIIAQVNTFDEQQQGGGFIERDAATFAHRPLKELRGKAPADPDADFRRRYRMVLDAVVQLRGLSSVERAWFVEVTTSGDLRNHRTGTLHSVSVADTASSQKFFNALCRARTAVSRTGCQWSGGEAKFVEWKRALEERYSNECQHGNETHLVTHCGLVNDRARGAAHALIRYADYDDTTELWVFPTGQWLRRVQWNGDDAIIEVDQRSEATSRVAYAALDDGRGTTQANVPRPVYARSDFTLRRYWLSFVENVLGGSLRERRLGTNQIPSLLMLAAVHMSLWYDHHTRGSTELPVVVAIGAPDRFKSQALRFALSTIGWTFFSELTVPKLYSVSSYARGCFVAVDDADKDSRRQEAFFQALHRFANGTERSNTSTTLRPHAGCGVTVNQLVSSDVSSVSRFALIYFLEPSEHSSRARFDRFHRDDRTRAPSLFGELLGVHYSRADIAEAEQFFDRYFPGTNFQRTRIRYSLLISHAIALARHVHRTDDELQAMFWGPMKRYFRATAQRVEKATSPGAIWPSFFRALSTAWDHGVAVGPWNCTLEDIGGNYYLWVQADVFETLSASCSDRGMQSLYEHLHETVRSSTVKRRRAVFVNDRAIHVRITDALRAQRQRAETGDDRDPVIRETLERVRRDYDCYTRLTVNFEQRRETLTHFGAAFARRVATRFSLYDVVDLLHRTGIGLEDAGSLGLFLIEHQLPRVLSAAAANNDMDVATE